MKAKPHVRKTAANPRTLPNFLRRLPILLALSGALAARAQLVADGGTNVLDGVTTNVVGSIIVGDHLPFTLLILTNSAAVTNDSDTIIGHNSDATNSQLVVSTGSTWNSRTDLTLGQFAAFNQLSIVSGGSVSNNNAVLGSHDNFALVDAAIWTNQGTLKIGGFSDQLVVTNGGKLQSGGAQLGYNSTENTNSMVVTDTNSVWTVGIFVNGNGSYNSVLITNGARVRSLSVGIGSRVGFTGFGGHDNIAIVTGPGSSWTNDAISSHGLVVGDNAFSNRVVIANGGVVSVGGTLGPIPGANTVGYYGSANSLLVTDPGSRYVDSSSFDLGYAGSRCALMVSNGAYALTGITRLSGNSGYSNQIVVSDAGSIWTNSSDLFLGDSLSPSNQLLVVNGAKVSDGNCTIASRSLAIVTGTGSVWSNRAALTLQFGGIQGNGTPFGGELWVTNGGMVYALNAAINNFAVVADPSSLWTNRGSITNTGTLIVTNGGTVVASNLFTANLFVTNGTITTTVGTFHNGFTTLLSPGTVALNPGTLTTDGLFKTNNGFASKLLFAGGTITTRTTTVSDQFPFTIGNGQSAATFNMISLNAPVGSTPGVHTFANGLVISSNATLDGIGIILGNVTNAAGGTLAHGINFKTVNLRGDLVLAAGSTNRFSVGSVSACDKFLDMTNVYFGGTLALSLPVGLSAAPHAFKLFGATNYFGAFSSLTPATPVAGFKWNTNELTVDGTLRVVADPTPPPVIASTLLDGANVVMTVTNGVAYDPVVLLSAADIALPLSNWTALTTNRFDAAGAASFTNAIPAGDAARFFAIAVQ